MTIQRKLIQASNKVLSVLNLELDSLTASRKATRVLEEARARGAFTKQAYPIPACFLRSRYQEVLEQIGKSPETFNRLASAAENSVGYEYGNHFFSSPDAEVLYSVVRLFKPQIVLELGCGNSTRITRLAIREGELATRLVCVDPQPRREVKEYADELQLRRVEDSDALGLVTSLKPNDILFIDTSHEVRPANDCAYIYGVLIPAVPAGVIVHIHDIFLPYEYSDELSFGDGRLWGEQTVVAVMLQNEHAWEAIWPGYYLQRTLQGFANYFPHFGDGQAHSLWLRRR